MIRTLASQIKEYNDPRSHHGDDHSDDDGVDH